MDLFEYQGKQYFSRFGIPVSPGGVAVTVDEAVEIADSVGFPVVVKAQVQVGGRGKAGGIKLANDTAEAREHAAAILGMDIKGHLVQHAVHGRDADEHRRPTGFDRIEHLHRVELRQQVAGDAGHREGLAGVPLALSDRH